MAQMDSHVAARLKELAAAGAAKAAPNDFVFCMRDRMAGSYNTVRSVMDSRWLYIHNYRPGIQSPF